MIGLLLALLELAQVAIAFVLPVILVRYAAWPRQWGLRAVGSVFVCWLALIAYTAFVYFPLGVSLAEKRGDEKPYAHFDNNNFVHIFVMGWFLSEIPLEAWVVVRLFMWTLGDSQP